MKDVKDNFKLIHFYYVTVRVPLALCMLNIKRMHLKFRKNKTNINAYGKSYNQPIVCQSVDWI